MLATFVAAADRVGLGTCPISTLRNNAGKVSDLLGLPDHVFPVAGLGVGWPSFAGVMSPRLGLDVTVHHDRYDEKGLKEKVAAYDKRRRAVQPYATQRHVDKFGEDPEYGWSEDKVRQYSVPDRADFGAFVRAQRLQTRLIVRFLSSSSTKRRSALDRLPGLRPWSISATRAFSDRPRCSAMAESSAQNASSSDTEVRWPSIVTERLRMRRTVAAAGRRLNPPCRRHRACV